MTLAVSDDQAPFLVAAAWLHDIGYATDSLVALASVGTGSWTP